MKGLPSEDVSLSDGEIIIDAALLAVNLGPSPEALKAETRKGLVYNVAETGADVYEGRTRFTFRYRSRARVVMVEPDRDGAAPVQRREPLTLLDLVRDTS